MSANEQFDHDSAATGLLPEISSPVCVDVAQTNVDAQLKAILLNESGIRAVAVDDISLGGYFALGAIRNIHRPQVFVDRSQMAAAREVLARHSEGSNGGLPAEEAVAGAFCYHCGAELPSDQSISFCPECRGLLQDADDAEAPGLSHGAIQRGRSLFQLVWKVGVMAMLVMLLPLLLRGIYVLFVLVSAPFRW